MAQHQQTVSEVRENRLSTKTKIIFGMGDYLNTVTYGMIGAFLMAFLNFRISAHISQPIQRLEQSIKELEAGHETEIDDGEGCYEV